MKRIWIFLSILPLLFLPHIVGTQTLAVVDELNASCNFEAEKQMLNNLLEKEAANKSEIYWRLSRATYRIGEAGVNNGNNKSELLNIFKKGESYADKALELDPINAYAFYWKASNLGLWTQLKGPIDGMKNINPLRDLLLTALSYDSEYPNSYFFLGQMYLEVPGWPIGYGNVNFAVSLARKGIWLYENKSTPGNPAFKIYTYYVKLAKILIKRNWSASKRQNNQSEKKNKYESSSDNFEKSCFFEGILTLEKISDREEAMKILTSVQKELKNKSTLTSLQKADLNEAEELLSKYNEKK